MAVSESPLRAHRGNLSLTSRGRTSAAWSA